MEADIDFEPSIKAEIGSTIELEIYRKQWCGNTRIMDFFAIIEMYQIQSKTLEFDGLNWLKSVRGDWQKIEKHYNDPNYPYPQKKSLLKWMLEPENRYRLSTLYQQMEMLTFMYSDTATETLH